MPDACVTFDDLTLGYESHPAIHHLNGVVAQGSLTAVVGANGCGKSTLMKSIAGMLRPLSGRCLVASGVRCAYLPQISELDRSFPARVIDLVSLGLWPRRGLLGRHGRADREMLLAALAAVGEITRPVEVRLHPDDITVLDTPAPLLHLIPDSSLSRGDVRVHADTLRIDGTLNARLDAALAEVIAQAGERA